MDKVKTLSDAEACKAFNTRVYAHFIHDLDVEPISGYVTNFLEEEGIIFIDHNPYKLSEYIVTKN